MARGDEFLGLAAQIATYAVVLEQGGRHCDAVPLMEQAYSAALTASSDMLVSVELRPHRDLPTLAHPEHLVITIGRQSLKVRARDDFIHQGLSHLRRLSLVGVLCGSAARMLRNGQSGECVVDIGDGSDHGDYRRFAFSSADPNVILIPDPYFFESFGYEALRREVSLAAPAWRDRRPVLFWRGGATGFGEPWPATGDPLDFTCRQRLSLCQKAQALATSGRVDIALTALDQIARPDIRNQIVAAGFVRPSVPKSEFLLYRYLVDIDGNTNSWGLFEKMIMGATILKVASRDGYRQWYYDRLDPWEHFVPVAADLSDFEEKTDWLFDHPAESEKIAAHAAELARSMDFQPVMLEAQARFALGLAQSGVALV